MTLNLTFELVRGFELEFLGLFVTLILTFEACCRLSDLRFDLCLYIDTGGTLHCVEHFN